MSYGNTPPPGGPPDSGQTPSDSPQEPENAGYGPPPSYGTPPPPVYGTPPPPDYGNTPPPVYEAPLFHDAPSPPNPYGSAPSAPFGSSPQYAASPPPPAYGQPYAAGVGTLALWPQRALGYLIDIALTIPGLILTSIDSQDGKLGALYFIGSTYVLGVDIWNRWIKGGTTGQTIGRGVVGTRLISEKTGQPIGVGMAFVRDLAHIVDAVICYVGFLFPLWDSKRQTLADKIVGTVVVTVPKS